MVIPDPPPDPTHFSVLLSDPEGYDAVEIRRMLEDCGLKVVDVEELSEREMEVQAKKPSDKVGVVSRHDRRAG